MGLSACSSVPPGPFPAMEAAMLTQLLDSLENPAPPPVSMPKASMPQPKARNSLQEAVDEAQLVFDLKWGQAAQAWEVLQGAKQALHNHEIAELHKEADRQLKIQKLVELIRSKEGSEKPKAPAATKSVPPSEKEIQDFNEKEMELDRKRKRTQELACQWEERQMEAVKQRAMDAAAASSCAEKKDASFDPPKPKARPKTGSVAAAFEKQEKKNSPGDLNQELAKMGYKISLEKVQKGENKKESGKVEQKKEKGKPYEPDGPPPTLASA